MADPAAGTCVQSCPPWLLDCGGHCASPGAGCGAEPRDLCHLGAFPGCSSAARVESMLATACAAEGYHTGRACPLAAALHGGCGGSRLMLASGLRAQVGAGRRPAKGLALVEWAGILQASFTAA
jgi:hypothetical protein